MKTKIKIKTVYEILKEYLERQKVPEYCEIGVLGDYDNGSSSYSRVSNIKTTYDEKGEWLEFDYLSSYDDKKRHAKLKGHVVRYIQDTN